MLSALIACVLCLQWTEKPVAMPASQSDAGPVATVAVTSAGPDSVVVSEPCVRDGQRGLLLTVYRLSPDRKLSRCSETFHALSAAAGQAQVPQQAPKRPWGTEQATGAPDTPQDGDIPTAWASETPDEQDEWLVLEYSAPVVAQKVAIYETYNPGAVNKVSVFTEDGREVVAWQGKDPTEPGSGMGVSTIPLSGHVRTKRIKVYVNSREIPGWNEIDAVGLIGENGETQWAVSATASSTYADLTIARGLIDTGFVGALHARPANAPATERPRKMMRASSPEPATTGMLLSEAVRAFNFEARRSWSRWPEPGPIPFPHGPTKPEDLARLAAHRTGPLDDGEIGTAQPELTEDEVLAAIEWLRARRDPKAATPEEYATLDWIASTRTMADGATFEVLTGYEPNYRVGFTVWSVRLVLPNKATGATHAFIIREQYLRVRHFATEERSKVIAKWQDQWAKQGGVASFDRPRYAEERRKARELDEKTGR